MNRRRDFYIWRLIATGASFLLFGLGGIILGYVIFPIVALISSSAEIETLRCRKMVQLCFRTFVWFMKTSGVLTWEVSGREKLTGRNQLVVANHPTLIDIVFLISMIPNASCIVKPEIYRNSFTKGPVSRAGYVANDAPEELVDNCVKTLESGASMVIFPEGTRSVNGVPLRFRRGAAYVQLQSQCSVVLAVITSQPQTLAKHEKWYQIPHSRPHFKLTIVEDKSVDIEQVYSRTAIGARALTQHWREFFLNEVVT